MINLGSVAEINRLVVPEMMERESGNLVHVGSIASSEAVGSVGYNTVKAGLAAYVRSIGKELARSHIVATGILVGGFTAPENAMFRLKTLTPKPINNLLIKDYLVILWEKLKSCFRCYIFCVQNRHP